jgi:hypothetical protein
MMTGLSTRYDLGSEREDVGRLIGDRPIIHGDADVSLYDVMQDGMGVFLDASTEGKASKLVAARTQRIRCVAVDTGASMLIRPDACIAWAGCGEQHRGIGGSAPSLVHPGQLMTSGKPREAGQLQAGVDTWRFWSL